MNKRELAALVAERAGIAKGDAAKAVQAMIECMTETLQAGGRITLMGFGSFFPYERPPRTTYNLYTKEMQHLDARKVVKFRPTFQKR